MKRGTGTRAQLGEPGRRRARPAPPRTTPTPGSSASRPTSPPRSGWASPTTGQSMPSICGGSQIRWHLPGAHLASVNEAVPRPSPPSRRRLPELRGTLPPRGQAGLGAGNRLRHGRRGSVLRRNGRRPTSPAAPRPHPTPTTTPEHVTADHARHDADHQPTRRRRDSPRARSVAATGPAADATDLPAWVKLSR